MKKILPLIFAIFFLTGCGSSVNGPVIVFDTEYSIQIPEGYSEISPALVENKQITNQVLNARKIDETTDEDFRENIVITKSLVGAGLDYEQFSTLNRRTLQNDLVGYVPGTLERKPFNCKDDEIPGIAVSFDIGGAQDQYFAQYQFVHQDHGYIISLATSDVSVRKQALKRIGNVSCDDIEIDTEK